MSSRLLRCLLLNVAGALRQRRVRVGALSIVSMVSIVVLGSLAGCHKRSADGPNTTNAPSEASVRQALDGLTPRLNELNAKFAALHRQFDPLPPSLPGFSEVRAKFYATDEGLGVMGPKLAWLSGRLEAASKAKDRAQLQGVSNDIATTYDEMRQIDQIALELVHQVLPFQRMAVELSAPDRAPTP